MGVQGLRVGKMFKKIKMKKLTAVIARANNPDGNGHVYSEGALRNLAKNNPDLHYDKKKKSLILGPIRYDAPIINKTNVGMSKILSDYAASAQKRGNRVIFTSHEMVPGYDPKCLKCKFYMHAEGIAIWCDKVGVEYAMPDKACKKFRRK